MLRLAIVATVVLALGSTVVAQAYSGSATKGGPRAQWVNGPSADPSYFPIAVWVQAPGRAKEYKDLGINLYIGLWGGPTEEQLAALKAAGMQTICAQNEVGLKHVNDKTIVGWMHGDEPDNCHSMETYWKNDLALIERVWPDVRKMPMDEWKRTFGGYGPPIPPAYTQRDYEEIRRKDPTRPVYLNLGTGVAFDSLAGRGVRSRHPEDYYEYSKGCDIVSYDTYPDRYRGERQGKLWYVARGVKRLHKYSGGQKIVWNIIEGSRSEATGNRPTAESLRSEAWMSIIHGSRGICYFVHLFRPSFVEAGVMGDTELMEGMKSLHAEIRSLAPVINSPTVPDIATVKSSVPVTEPDMLSDELQAIALMAKKHEGATYVFSIRMEGSPATGEFQVAGLPARATAEVLGENRSIPVRDGRFTDDFTGYQVHIYRIGGR